MERIVWIAAMGLLVTGGCRTWSPLGRRAPVRLACETEMSGLAYAQLLQEQGDYLPAVIEYRKLIDSGGEPWECEEARIGAAECLLKLRKYPAAVAALGPLPISVASETDCHKLAIAGEALLRQHRTEEAECYLEIALDNVYLEGFLCCCDTAKHEAGTQGPKTAPSVVDFATQEIVPCAMQEGPNVEVIPPGSIVAPAEMYPPGQPGTVPADVPPTPAMATPYRIEPPSWLPPCCANLGCAYLKNDKPQKAAVLYCYAAQLYRRLGNQIAADRAQRMGDDLIAVIRQYAPFKPRPWMHGAPPGRQ